MWALGLRGVCIEMVWVGFGKELIVLLLQRSGLICFPVLGFITWHLRLLIIAA